MGALSFSPSPMTTTPSIEMLDSTMRMALTAAPSAPSLSPRPIHREAARAAASVTRTSSMARLRSGAWVRRWCSRTTTIVGGTRTRSPAPTVRPRSGGPDAGTRMLDCAHGPGKETSGRAAFAGARLRDADFETMSGVPLQPVYGPEDRVAAGGRRAARRGGSGPGSTRTPGARTPRCTARSCGRCGCSPASGRPRTPTPASTRSSGPAGTGCRWPSTCPR